VEQSLFLMSFSVRTEELYKTSYSIRPLNREFKEICRENESGCWSLLYEFRWYSVRLQLENLCCFLLLLQAMQKWPNISCSYVSLAGNSLKKTFARFIHLQVKRNLNFLEA